MYIQKIKILEDENIPEEKINDFFKKNINYKKSKVENYLIDYFFYSGNFFNIVKNKKVHYVYILYNNNDIVHVSCLRKSNFHENIFILCVRAITNENYRSRGIMLDYIIPLQIEDSKNHKSKMCLLTFNENYKLYIEQNKRLKNKQSFMFGNIENKDLYNCFNYVNFPCNIFNTKQWVLYIKLDETFDYDFNNIKYSEEKNE